jgi:hypothetical protein
MTEDILSILSGGDRRSIGRADDALAALDCDPSLLEALFTGMLGDDPVVAMRSADVAEKYSLTHPNCLDPYKQTLLEQVAPLPQQEIRWHAAQMIPRLKMSPGEVDLAIARMQTYLQDPSGIVRTFAMQALFDLAQGDEGQLKRIRPLLEKCTRDGTPAMRTRGKKLLKQLDAQDRGAQ